jgi:hypothetical protein
MSLGGSALLANWSITALLLRISDQARRPVPDGDGLHTIPRRRPTPAAVGVPAVGVPAVGVPAVGVPTVGGAPSSTATEAVRRA